MWRTGVIRRSFGYDPPITTKRRRFVCYFYHNGWDAIQLGIHLSLLLPNLEIHVPFGFLRVGWSKLDSETNR